MDRQMLMFPHSELFIKDANSCLYGQEKQNLVLFFGRNKASSEAPDTARGAEDT